MSDEALELNVSGVVIDCTASGSPFLADDEDELRVKSGY